MKGYQLDHYLSVPEFGNALSHNIPEPVPAEGEILIDVYAAALNFFDILQFQGKYQYQPKFPWVAGQEFSGIISPNSPIPKGCPWIAGKTRVFGNGQGAFAERVAAPWVHCREIPALPNAVMSYEEAAGLSVTFPTSWTALVDRANIQPGETLLVHAAAGGVGIAALQIGKALGATVIATAGSAEKLEFCKRAGADYVLDYTKDTWQKEVSAITKGKGVDVVYDPVGLAVPSLKCIAWKGRVIIVGFAAGTIEKIPANLILLKNIAVTGLHWGAYMMKEPEAIPGQWEGIFKLFSEGKLRGMIYPKLYTFETLGAGLKDLGDRSTYAKVIVTVKKDGKL